MIPYRLAFIGGHGCLYEFIAVFVLFTNIYIGFEHRCSVLDV
jgi:hypothetical protein